MHRLIIFVLLVFLPVLVTGQASFEAGSIVSSTGDTISGLVKIQNSDLCTIKAEKGTHAQEYLVSELKSVTFENGRHFIAKEISLGGGRKSVILEYLVSGKASLYHFRDGVVNYYFIQMENGDLQPLMNTETERSIDSKLYIIENEEYKTTLRSQFSDAPALIDEISSLPFNNKSLIDITIKYHNAVCDYDCLVYRKNTKSTIHAGLIGGINASSLYFKVKSQQLRTLKNESFVRTPGFQIGLALMHTHVFGFTDKISFNSNLMFLQNRFEATNLSIKQTSLHIPLYLNYHLSRGEVKPFLSFGITNTIFLSNNIIEDEVNYKPDFEDVWGSYAFGLLGGAGLLIESGNLNYGLTAHYELGNGLHRAKDIANNVLSSWTDKFFVNFTVQANLSK